MDAAEAPKLSENNEKRIISRFSTPLAYDSPIKSKGFERFSQLLYVVAITFFSATKLAKALAYMGALDFHINFAKEKDQDLPYSTKP